MSFRRVGWVAAIALATVLEISCGQVYRPVVIPINNVPPNPQNFHAVFGLSTNVSIGSQFSSIVSVSESGTLVTVTLSSPLTNAVSGAPIQISGASVIGYDGIFSISQVSGGGATITYQDCSTGLTPAAGGTAVVLSLSTESSSILSASESTAGLVTATLNAPLANTTSGAPIIISGVCTGAMATGYDGDFFISQVNAPPTPPPSISYEDSVIGLPPASGGTATALSPGPSSLVTSISESTSGLVTAALFPPLTDATSGGPIVISGVSISGYDGNFFILQVSDGGSTVTYQDPVLDLLPTSGGAANVPILNQGTALQLDVSGDTIIGEADMGVNPTHAAILPNHSRVFVASAGSLFPGETDVVTAFFPAGDSSTATGLGNTTTFTLPNVGANQTAGVLSVSESGTTVTMKLSAPLLDAQVGIPIVVSGVVIPCQNPLGNPPCTIPPNPSAYDGNFPITSVSGNTIQYTDCQLVNNVCVPLLPVTTPGGSATIPVPLFCSYQPDYVTTSQNSAVYVANYGQENGANCNLSSTDSIAVLNPTQNTISNIQYLPAGSHPVAMVETPNGENLYVVNQGNNTVTNLSPTDQSTIATISVGNTPVWAVSRVDGLRVYVLAQGSGTLVPIDTATNTVLANLSVGPGANSLVYDPNLNRLYVTNPGTVPGSTAAVYVFSTSGGVNDTPTLLSTIPMTAGSIPCLAGCSPQYVAALPDGSRFYVASFATETACTDPNLGAGAACMVPMVTVFDALSFTPKPASSSLLSPPTSLSLLTTPQFAATQFAVPPVAACIPAATYAPGTTRFRMFAAASADSSHVYVSICDANAIADITTTTNTISTGVNNAPDTLVTDIIPPFSAAPPVNGEPPPQNPVFLLTGQ